MSICNLFRQYLALRLLATGYMLVARQTFMSWVIAYQMYQMLNIVQFVKKMEILLHLRTRFKHCYRMK